MARAQFLAGTALAGQEHVHVGLGQLADMLENLPHGFALADHQVVGFARQSLGGLLYRGLLEAGDAASARQDHLKLFYVHGLLQEVESPALHRASAQIGADVGSDDDDLRQAILMEHRVDDLQAALGLVLQPHVQADDPGLLAPQGIQASVQGLGLEHLVFRVQGPLHLFPESDVVFDKEELDHVGER